MNTLEFTNNLTKGYAHNRGPKAKLEEIARSRYFVHKLLEQLDKEKERIIESINEE